MFSSRHRAPEPEPEREQIENPDQLTPEEVQNLLDLRTGMFDLLEARLGKESVDGMRQDFQKHLDTDERYGAEAGWVCLVGKMIRAMDRLTEALMAADAGVSLTQRVRQTSPGVEGFTFYGKDA